MNRIIAAAQFAKREHEGQIRKDGNEKMPTPYFTHLARVAGTVAALPGSNENMVIAAYLHDTIEDTDVTLAEIELSFGAEVAIMVECLTNVSKRNMVLAKKNRTERKKADTEFLSKCSPNIKKIKLADRLDNLFDFSLTNNPFKYKYAAETQDLLKAIGDACPELTEKIEEVLQFILVRTLKSLDEGV